MTYVHIVNVREPVPISSQAAPHLPPEPRQPLLKTSIYDPRACWDLLVFATIPRDPFISGHSKAKVNIPPCPDSAPLSSLVLLLVIRSRLSDGGRCFPSSPHAL